MKLVLLLAAVYLLRSVRARRAALSEPDMFLLVTWLLVMAVVCYLPFVPLQRRFAVAAFVPVAVLAAKALFTSTWLNTALVQPVLLACTLLTNTILLLVSLLAVDDQVAASTQNQPLSALLFLYRDVLEVDLPWS